MVDTIGRMTRLGGGASPSSAPAPLESAGSPAPGERPPAAARSRRPLIAAAVAVVVVAVVGVIIATQSSGGSGHPSAAGGSTRSGGTATTAPAPPVVGIAGEQLLQAIDSTRAATYHASYSVTGFKGGSLTLEIWQAPPNLREDSVEMADGHNDAHRVLDQRLHRQATVHPDGRGTLVVQGDFAGRGPRRRGRRLAGIDLHGRRGPPGRHHHRDHRPMVGRVLRGDDPHDPKTVHDQRRRAGPAVRLDGHHHAGIALDNGRPVVVRSPGLEAAPTRAIWCKRGFDGLTERCMLSLAVERNTVAF